MTPKSRAACSIPESIVYQKSSALLSSSSLSLSLPYIGQQEYDSGYEAGRRLIQAGVTQGWCVVHATFDTLYERCRGMEAAFLDANDNANNDDNANKIKFMDIIYVPITVNNNDRSNSGDDVILSTYKYIVESILGEDNENENDDTDPKDNWSGYGLLSTGKIQIPSLLSLVTDHPLLLVGTFDTIDSALLVSYEHERQRQRRKIMEIETTNKKNGSSRLRTNTPPRHHRRLPSSSLSSIQDQIIFSIDQNAYLQGYLSVATLVLKLSTFGEGPTNKIVQTGPTFIEGGGTGRNARTTTIPPPKCRHQEKKNDKFCTVTKNSGTSIITTTITTTNDVDGPIINPSIQENREEPPLKISGKCSQLGRLCEMCEGTSKSQLKIKIKFGSIIVVVVVAVLLLCIYSFDIIEYTNKYENKNAVHRIGEYRIVEYRIYVL